MGHSAEEQALPRYQLTQPLYAGDEFIPIDEVVEIDDPEFIPNESMIPLNEPARIAFQRFMDSVQHRDLGDIVEEAYRNRPRHEIVPQVPREHREVRMPTEKTVAPLTGYDGNTQSMTSKRKTPVKSVGLADNAGVKGSKRVMGTVNQETPRGI